MALTEIQRDICRLLAKQRIASGESYVAGGAALNEIIGGTRISRDLDLFHDTREALAATWASDRAALAGAGYQVELVVERPAFVEAVVHRGSDSVILQWTHDSAFRFFPLVEHTELGLTLHAFDLATNKVLALAGRLEPRDWIDVIHCDAGLQPLGLLAWAASGKDPGLSPPAILDQAGRSARYSSSEIRALAFDGEPPDAAALSRRWHTILATAERFVDALPSDRVGECVLANGDLFRGDPDELRGALQRGEIQFHPGSIRGAFPRFVE
ncbi:MAG TPA: hypothetical protein VMT00_13505 [Thermoanaerobaculia bacterium]|nr:hypothetical protein [Thermoanaerobaculia bacterium]